MEALKLQVEEIDYGEEINKLRDVIAEIDE